MVKRGNSGGGCLMMTGHLTLFLACFSVNFRRF